MTRAWSIVPLLLAALIAPASASAHHARGLTDAERHAAADLAGVSVTTLERRVNAIARKLGRKPGTRVSAAAAAVGDPGDVGTLVRRDPGAGRPDLQRAAAERQDPDVGLGRRRAGRELHDHTFTRAAVYDPVTNTSKRVDVAGYNIFCAGFVQLANGNVFVAGGNLDTRARRHPPDARLRLAHRDVVARAGHAGRALVPVGRRRCPTTRR